MTMVIRQARFIGPLFPLLLFVAVAGCGYGSNQASAPRATTVRDSAGVRIVTSETPQWDAGAGWTVVPEPSVTIGTEDPMGGDETSVFFGSIRSMVVLPSQRFAVADEHSAVVSVFDPDGQLVHRFGGRGEGPGEVGGIWNLYGCAGDTVVVRPILAHHGSPAFRMITSLRDPQSPRAGSGEWLPLIKFSPAFGSSIDDSYSTASRGGVWGVS